MNEIVLPSGSEVLGMVSKAIAIRDVPRLNFSQPRFCFGQEIVTKDGRVGYVTGLNYVPEEQAWHYELYSANPKSPSFIEEWWFPEDDLHPHFC
ncbi:MAG TPA: hypothetical protein ACFE0H_04570 [Elainellaceae cyanobacterium]